MEKRRYIKPEITIYALPEMLDAKIDNTSGEYASSGYVGSDGTGNGDAKGFSLWDDEEFDD